MPDEITRLRRQQDLVPFEKLRSTHATVIGVGAIGRQVALQLAAVGVRTLSLFDFDTVDETNITTQGYATSDVGQLKVSALRADIDRIDESCCVQAIGDRYRPHSKVGEAIFCCVDSISARAAIWRSAQDRCRFWCDGRMVGETIRILSVAEEAGRDHYPATLFPQSAAQTGRCTAGGTIYTANIAAGLMLHQFVRWLRHHPIDTDLSLNLLASELQGCDP